MRFLCILILLTVSLRASAIDLYVSSTGSDAWSGRIAAPNTHRSDGPFATLERARDAVRALRKSGKLRGAVTVWLRGGTYARDHSLDLSAEDGGTASAPVVWSAYRGEEVRVSGGREVRGWKPVTDAAILDRLDPPARQHVLQANLRAEGITDFGELRRRGFGAPTVPAALELFFGDKPMALAHWPNEGWAKTASAPGGPNGGRFSYEASPGTVGRAAAWGGSDAWVHGYWTWDWADSYERVVSVDPATREIVTAPPHGVYGYAAGKRFQILNVLEELDAPGEYYLDRKSGILYFWPPAPIDSKRAVVSLVEQPLVRITGASYITLRGLTLECGRASGMAITGGSHCIAAGCRLRNLGTDGASIEGGEANGLQSCDLYDLGDGGVRLSGGDRKMLTPAGNFVDNCDMARFSRWDRTYRPAVLIDGVGCRITHCRIHDAPHSAIILGGNDHLIEGNEIYRVCTQTGDAGAFYMGRNWTMLGNIVRGNYFHDIGRKLEGRGGFLDVMSVYLDDCACGTTVSGNLFVRAGRAVMIGGGRDNTIENNVFIDCAPAIHVDARGLGWAKFWFDGRDNTLIDGLKAMPVDSAPWRKYPHLANILQDEPALAKYNRITHNIRSGGGWIEWLDGMSDRIVEVRDNLLDGDPGFLDAAHRDYRLRPDSAARSLGIQPLAGPFGLRLDALRRRLPAD